MSTDVGTTNRTAWLVGGSLVLFAVAAVIFVITRLHYGAGEIGFAY